MYGLKFSLFLLVASDRVLFACQSACLPDLCVSGKDLARNLCNVPLNCRSCVSVSFVMIDRQIFVQKCLSFGPNWGFFRLFLPSTTFSNIGKSVLSCFSGQHSNMSWNNSRIRFLVINFLMEHSTAKSKKLPSPSSTATYDDSY